MNRKTATLGERLYLLRNQHGITQEELAEKLDVSRQTVSNWENDKVKLDVEKAAALCCLYGISMDELFLGKERESVPSASGDRGVVILTIVLIIFCVALAIMSIVFLAVTQTDDSPSSVVYLDKSAWWIVPLFCGVAGCAVLTWQLVKHFKMK